MKRILVNAHKPLTSLTRKQIKRLTTWGYDDALAELTARIGRDRAVKVWNKTAYNRADD